MKKFLTIISIVLCFVLMFALVSCKNEPDDKANETVKETENETVEETKVEEKPVEPTTATELWKLVDNAMNNVESYEADLSFDSVIFINGYKMVSKGTGFEIRIGDENDIDSDYYRYLFLKTDASCEELSINETTNNIEAYNQGMTFISTVKGESAQSFCSKMTVEEYLEFNNSVLSDELDLSECMKSEFSKNEDGSWIISFSGYTKKSIGLFLKEIGFDEIQSSADIIDMKLSMTADSQYRVGEMVFELVFDVEETDTSVPVFKEVMKYSKYGEAKKTLEGIDPSEYTEVDDITVLGKVGDAIDEYANSAEGKFKLDLNQTFKVGAESNSYNEVGTVSFGKVNGAFTFTVESMANGTTVEKIEYKNGVQTVTEGADSESYSLSEAEAKIIVHQLINTAAYDESYVTNIEKLGEDVYKFTVDEPDISAYEESLSPMGITCKSGKQSIVVTFADDKLSKIESDLTVFGEMTVGSKTEAMELKQLTTVTVNAVNGSDTNI